jgi:outer membrane protein, multidrug efflux system
MSESTALRISALAWAVATLAGCTAVGPNYQAQAPTLDPGFIAAGSSAVRAEPVSADIASFWRGFQDAKLNALVESALAANGDVRIAQARLQEARALQGQSDAAGLPGVGIDTSATRAVSPITQRPGTTRGERTGNTLDASFVAAWEIDLFGGLRRASEAAAARVGASEAGVHATHTAVAAEVARNYMELRGLQQRQQFTEDSLINLRDALRINSARVDAGRGTQLDVARAQGLVAGTEAALPALQTAIEQTVYRLATLTGQPPRALLGELSAPAPLPSLPVTDLATLPLGTPQQWLQRRPDLLAAEREVAAATADIGVATAELYPRLSLSGLLGLNAGSFSGLGRAEAARYSVGAGLTWTPFDSGAIRARIRGSEARAAQSLARFDLTLATALEETEGAFSSYTRTAQRLDRLNVATRSAQEAAGLARKRFDAGFTDFLAVLDAEREVLNSRDQLVQAQVGVATSLVAVYRTLGGGWTPQAR